LFLSSLPHTMNVLKLYHPKKRGGNKSLNST
jgi:hypothetical protein